MTKLEFATSLSNSVEQLTEQSLVPLLIFIPCSHQIDTYILSGTVLHRSQKPCRRTIKWSRPFSPGKSNTSLPTGAPGEGEPMLVGRTWANQKAVKRMMDVTAF
jgi:hypothetical protein